jgi:hypothetical protein
MRVSERLALQNDGAGWRDCLAVGLRHRPGEVQLVGGGAGQPVARYTTCLRCPVVIRTTEPSEVESEFLDALTGRCPTCGSHETPAMHAVLGHLPRVAR